MKTLIKPSLFLVTALLITNIAARAQENTIFKLKHRSEFSSATVHNPFWPIGWVKGENQTTTTQEAVVPVSASNFTVSSISISATPLAVINGKTYAEGEVISAMYGGQRMTIRLVAIHDGDVVLEYQGKRYTIPMKRPEFIQKSVPGDTLPKQDNTLILH
jgi:hypothetical protein